MIKIQLNETDASTLYWQLFDIDDEESRAGAVFLEIRRQLIEQGINEETA
jgi:hypothetical protein